MLDCYLALRGLKTLHVRMEAAQSNAAKIAAMLESHKNVERVIYPGLASHPQHDLARKQASGYGAMITFFVKGGLEEASKFLSALKIFTLAESLGAVESLAESPAIMVCVYVLYLYISYINSMYQSSSNRAVYVLCFYVILT